MPKGAVYVGRPTKWGNPYAAGDWSDPVAKYRAMATAPGMQSTMKQLLAAIRGKDLACWCPLDQPCHADVLLELANK
jgi:hypothetical protein